MRAWPNILGWSADRDRQYLYDLIVAIPARVVVEIGIYAGRMTVALAEAVRVTGGIVHSVDPWQEMADGPMVARAFLDTITKYDLQDVVRIHAETSEAFSKRLAGTVDLVWIDGGHSYQDVETDLVAWGNRAANIYGHDWHLPGVRHAAEAYAQEHGMTVGIIPGTDNIWTMK